MNDYISDVFGEDAAKALKQHFNQIDEVTKKEIKLTGDLAWAQTMYNSPLHGFEISSVISYSSH